MDSQNIHISSKKIDKGLKMSDQEFIVRIPARIERKKYHIMKFNASMNVDVGKWNQVNIKRYKVTSRKNANFFMIRVKSECDY